MSKNNNTAPSIYTTVDVISTEILAGDMLLATLGRIHAGVCSSYRYVVILDMKGKRAVRKYSTIGEAFYGNTFRRKFDFSF